MFSVPETVSITEGTNSSVEVCSSLSTIPSNTASLATDVIVSLVTEDLSGIHTSQHNTQGVIICVAYFYYEAIVNTHCT